MTEIIRNGYDKSTRFAAILNGLRCDTRHFPAGSFVECVALGSRKSSERYTLPCSSDGLVGLAKTLDIVADYPVSLYIRANPVNGPLDRGHGGFARDGDVISDITTLIDIDPEKNEDGTTPEANIKQAALIADGIETFIRELFDEDAEPYEPVVVNSGRGYQIRIQHEDLGDDGSELKQILLNALNFKFGCPGAVIVDPCTHDKPRLMRLVGSTNRRTGSTAKLISEGVGVMSRRQYDRLINASTDGLDDDEMRHRIAQERKRATTAAKRDLMAGRTSDRVISLPELSIDEAQLFGLSAQERELINAIRAAGVPRGRQHYTRIFLSGALLDLGMNEDRAELVIWLGLAESNNRQARKDSAGSIRTTARRIKRGDNYASIGTLELEVGGASFRAIEDAIYQWEFVSEYDEIERSQNETTTSRPSTGASRTPTDPKYLATTEGAEACISVLGVSHVDGVDLEETNELVRIASMPDRKKERAKLRNMVWSWAGGEDRIKDVQRLGIAAGTERWSIARELGISHSITSRQADWLRAARVDKSTRTFRDDPASRKLGRLARCGAFCREHVLIETGETIRRVGYCCELYECLFCGSYIWDAGRHYSKMWPERVLVLRIKSEEDNPSSCAAMWNRIASTSKARIPKAIGLIHPGASWTDAGIFVAIPASDSARLELDRVGLEYEETSGEEACYELVQRAWIRPMRINRRIAEQDDSILSDPWLEAGRFRAIRQRGSGDWRNEFHFPTKEGWEEIRKIIEPLPGKDDRPQLHRYKHVASGIVVAERASDEPPLLEHEVAEEASRCAPLKAHLDARARKHLKTSEYELVKAAERNETSPWRSYPQTE